MDNRWPFLVALVLVAPAAAAECEVEAISGQEEGIWEDPVSIGTAASWQEHDITDPALIAAMDTITITLEWENGPGGGADFGIAIGTSDGFYYWNQQYQAALGSHSESITLDQNDLEVAGWRGEDLRIGPSISTGGAGLSGIPYTITWEATLDPDICGEGGEGAVPSDGGGLSPAPGESVPVQWWIGAGVALVAVGALIAFSTRK